MPVAGRLTSTELPRYLPTLERLSLLSRRRDRSRSPGRRPGIAKGSSIEFADFRRYTSGDDIRHIDWTLYARSKQLFVREFQAETDLNVHVLVDASASMGLGRPTKLSCASQIASMLSYVGISNYDRVGVTTFGSDVLRRLPPERGRQRLFQISRLLAETTAGGETDFQQAFERYGGRARSRGLAVIVSDFLSTGGYRAGLEYLLYKKFEVAVIQVLADEELEPTIEGRVELRDSEDGDLATVSADELSVEAYLVALEEHNADLDELCRRRGCAHARILTSDAPETVIRRLLDAGIWRSR